MNDFNDSVRWARAYDAFGRTGTGLRRPYGQGTTQPLRERSRVDHGAPSPEQIMAAHNIRLFPLRDSVVSVLTYNVLQGNKRYIISLCTVLSTKFRTPVIYLVDIKLLLAMQAFLSIMTFLLVKLFFRERKCYFNIFLH